jgi:hypothetical protein
MKCVRKITCCAYLAMPGDAAENREAGRRRRRFLIVRARRLVFGATVTSISICVLPSLRFAYVYTPRERLYKKKNQMSDTLAQLSPSSLALFVKVFFVFTTSVSVHTRHR